MKKLMFLLIAVVLAACSTPVATATEPPVAAVVEPSATPIVVVQTVVVEASPVPTDVPAATPIPPTVAPVVVTVLVEQPTQPAPAATADTSNGAITLDNTLGRGVFTNMTMSSNAFTLRCSPRDITFNIATPNVDIKDVVFYYRVVDDKRLYPSEWKTFGKMVANGSGNFTLTFTGENIHPDLRIDGSWFDFQFVGLGKSGSVIDRSAQFESLVKYTFDCP